MKRQLTKKLKPKLSPKKISRMDKSALARECAKLDRKSEQAMADEGLATEISAWPKY